MNWKTDLQRQTVNAELLKEVLHMAVQILWRFNAKPPSESLQTLRQLILGARFHTDDHEARRLAEMQARSDAYDQQLQQLQKQISDLRYRLNVQQTDLKLIAEELACLQDLEKYQQQREQLQTRFENYEAYLQQLRINAQYTRQTQQISPLLDQIDKQLAQPRELLRQSLTHQSQDFATRQQKGTNS